LIREPSRFVAVLWRGALDRHEKGNSKMKKILDLDQTYDFFSANRTEDIVILRLKENLLARAADLNAKNALFDYLEVV